MYIDPATDLSRTAAIVVNKRARLGAERHRVQCKAELSGCERSTVQDRLTAVNGGTTYHLGRPSAQQAHGPPHGVNQEASRAMPSITSSHIP
jgi:hypothetical protein